MQSEISEKLKKIIEAQLNFPPDMINEDTNFHANLGMDSIDVVNLVNAINIEFNIKLTEQDVLDIETVKEMVKCIYQHLQQ